MIYCDESDDRGKYFSHFYGGAAVDANKRERIEAPLNAAYTEQKIALNVAARTIPSNGG